MLTGFDAEVEVLYSDNPTGGMQRNGKDFRQSVNRDCWSRLRVITARRVSHGEFQIRGL
jgi:uncharacterized protein YlaI